MQSKIYNQMMLLLNKQSCSPEFKAKKNKKQAESHNKQKEKKKKSRKF